MTINVVWQTDKGNERIECVSMTHANEVYASITATKKKITVHENGRIKQVSA